MDQEPAPEWMPPTAPEPIGPELLERPFPWFESILGVLAFLLCAVCCYWLYRRIRSGSELPPSPLEGAIEAIEVAKESEGAVMASELSLIIRSYLYAVTGDEAVYETGEELSNRRQVLKGLPERPRKEVLALLDKFDQLRYRPSVESNEVRPLVATAGDLLREIDQELETHDKSS